MSETTKALQTGAATGGVRMLLRLEGLTLFAGMTVLYAVWDGSWWVYAILFLVPDLSFAAYLAGPQVGAIVYNAAHSYFGPRDADDHWIRDHLAAYPFHRDDLAGAYRHRSRAGLRPEIQFGISFHPSRRIGRDAATAD